MDNEATKELVKSRAKSAASSRMVEVVRRLLPCIHGPAAMLQGPERTGQVPYCVRSDAVTLQCMCCMIKAYCRNGWLGRVLYRFQMPTDPTANA